MILFVALRWALCWDFTINRNLFCIWIIFEDLRFEVFEFLRRVIYVRFLLQSARLVSYRKVSKGKCFEISRSSSRRNQNLSPLQCKINF